MSTFLNYLQFYFLIISIIFISLIVSWEISINYQKGWLNISINEYNSIWEVSKGKTPDTLIQWNDHDLESKWFDFISIFTTLLVAFFIYSSFKIDNDLQKISNVKEEIKKIEDNAEASTEFSNHLQYGIQYMVSKQYSKAIDALTVLRNDVFTLKDSRRKNTCLYFLAVCYYEQWLVDTDLELIAKAVEYIQEWIEDPSHPLKIEIIAKFDEMSNMDESFI